MENTFTIRQCRSHDDLKLCVDLERRIWRYADEDVVPAAIFVVAQHTGGHVLCAFDSGTPVGFTLAFSAESNAIRYWHSHMAGVLPEYQNRGVGRLLKVFQREEALRAGVGRIHWTFDPFEPRNAYFNICRLGVVVRRYIPNCYGLSTSPLHRGQPTDRVVAEWKLSTERVVAAIESPDGIAPASGPCALQIPIPPNIGEQEKACLRGRLQELFSRGYAITGFLRRGESSHYVLEPYED